MLDRLADPIIMSLLKEAPQLALVNRKMYCLAELLAHTRLLTFFDYENNDIEELATDIRTHMQFESWHTAEGVAKSDYWIFAPQHVVGGDTARRGIYTLPGEPYGLQLTMAHSRTLHYDARLRCGTYTIYIDALMSPLLLSQISIDVINSPHAHPHFARSPMRRWLATQVDDDAAQRLESLRWRVGTLTIAPSTENQGEWADFTIALQIYGFDAGEEGAGSGSVVLNYIKFEPQQHNSETADWVLAAPNDRPSFGMAEVYRRASERKRRWSMRQQRYLTEVSA